MKEGMMNDKQLAEPSWIDLHPTARRQAIFIF